MANLERIKVLNRKQGNVKAKLTNLRKHLEDYPVPEVPNVEENVEVISKILTDSKVSAAFISKWFDANKALLQEFDALHNEILEIEADDAVQKRYAEFVSFEACFLKSTACATVRLANLNDLINVLSVRVSQSRESSNYAASNEPLGAVNDSTAASTSQSAAQNTGEGSTTPSATHVNGSTVNTNVVSTPNSKSAIDNNVLSHTSNAPIQLPFLSLQKFEGQCEYFNTFFESFKSLIHNNSKLPTMSKFLYLKDSLGKEPQRVIEHLDLLEGNYETALHLLQKRYRDEKLMIHTHIKGIIECPSVNKNNSSSLRVISDSVQAHLRALETLGEPVQSWSSLIQYIVLDKLDFNGRREWENVSVSLEHPSLTDLFNFLERRCHLIEKIDKTKDNIKHSNIRDRDHSSHRFKAKGPSNIQAFVARSQPSCAVCKGSHFIYSCRTFLDKTVSARLAEVQRLGLCENCLRFGHKKSECKSQHCKKCALYHATLLHPPNETAQTVSAVCLGISKNPVQILPTAEIFIYDSQGKAHKCVALLDSAAQSSYMTHSLHRKLKLPTKSLPNPLQIQGIESIKSTSVKSLYCEASIQSRHTNFTANASFVLLNSITNRLPALYVDSSQLSFPSNLPLANPNYYNSCHIDLLLGVGLFWSIIRVPQADHFSHPLLQSTQLGYVVSGELGTDELQTTSNSFCALSISDISRQLHKFWEIEAVESTKAVLSPDELKAEQNFVCNTTRNDQGQFTVCMPLCADPTTLGDSRERALRQFRSLERRLNSNAKLKTAYSEFMREYEVLGHMTKVSCLDDNLPSYYLPHHPVFKADSLTTKLRVVFNSSAQTTNGISLCDIQINGPTIQNELFSILIRFRRFQYVLSADCSKMYRCVFINPMHRPLQRIFWRYDPTTPIETYELNTVTYGQRASSFLAIRCLFQLAEDCESEHPLISKIIRNDMYCDDLLTSCQTLDDALYIGSNVSKVLASGGFILRKWNSNEPRALLSVVDDSIANNVLQFGPNETTKTLGLIYNSYSDEFLYKLKNNQFKSKPTKRLVLSFMSSIFDPLGLISPCVITLKIFMQSLWSTQSSWDAPLDPQLESFCYQYFNDLQSLSDLKIPRQTICNSHSSLELHAFSDASEKAYGACIYLKSKNEHNDTQIHLLCSKTKVSPLKSITIPKLELCASLLMAQLVSRVKTDLDVSIDSVTYWTDSTIVLSWVQTAPHLLNTFVSNRVAQIQELSNVQHWRHVPTEFNPADLLSRGLSPVKLQNTSLWWNGPHFLTQPETNWPRSAVTPSNTLPELKSSRALVVQSHPDSSGVFPFVKHSSIEKMRNTMAYVLRFLNNCRQKASERTSGPLQLGELNCALIQLARLSQIESFPEEFKMLNQGKAVSNQSKLSSLTPFISQKDDTMRVRGRLLNSSFNYNKKHPLIICGKHWFTRKLFEYYHRILLHTGPQQLLCSIRERFWPINGRNLSKSVYRSCLTCFRCNPKPIQSIMGNLPADRLAQNSPFAIVGTDYCGPFLIKSSSTRKHTLIKCYVCLFVCFSTKAIHLEPVVDLSTEAFISTLRAFASRRGMPSRIYSDNGRNYVGARTELHKLGQFLLANKDDLPAACANANFEWRFIPPYSPNMGGLWEAGVKSSKNHLKRVIGEQRLTFFQFYHVLVQVEGVLNSRPLSPLSSLSVDLLPLTPAHFLIGRPITTVPDPNVLEIQSNRLGQYQQLQQMLHSFWNRWMKEYVSELQQRYRWKKSSGNVKIGTLVVVKDDNLPPSKWQLGRITELHPGKDGVVRVASILLSNGVGRRAISKICPLPDQE